MITFLQQKKNETKKEMNSVRGRLFEGLETVFLKELPDYIVKISQVKKLFYVLVQKLREGILG